MHRVGNRLGCSGICYDCYDMIDMFYDLGCGMPVNVYVAMMIRSGSAEKPYWMALQPTTRLLSFVRYLTNARACVHVAWHR